MTAHDASGISPTTDEARAIATLTIAFSSDPVARWFLCDAGRYLTYWPPFVTAIAGKAFAAGTADSIGDCGGIALWLPAYLEATNPRNVRLYAAHGFEELGVIQAGGSPPVWPMLRKPCASPH